VTLFDGSRVELNTATNVRANVTPARREVWLDSGEA
jgi:transmembrane sensor